MAPGKTNHIKMSPTETSSLTNLSKEEAQWLAWVQMQFTEIAGDDGQIDLEEFKTALKVKKSFFAERFFALFDGDNSGTIDLSELMEGLKKLTKGSSEQKLRFLFDVYDVDGSGTVDRDELKTVLESCTEESSLKLSDEDLEALTDALFEEADEDNNGSITFEEFYGELAKYPGVLENLTISAASWLKPPNSNKKKSMEKPRYLSKRYLENNTRKIIFIGIYHLLNAALFTLSAVRYRNSNFCVIIARGCGMCLNFNGAFVIVLMLRYCLTWLRSTKLGNYLPLDQSVLFHKIVGVNIAVFTVGHTIAHVGNLALIKAMALPINSTNASIIATVQGLSYWEILFTLKAGIGFVGPGFAYLSGIILDVILIVMFIGALPFVRRSGYFQVFYWTHTLYIPFLILLILHGPIFWMFFIVPGIIFVIERINMSKVAKLAKYGNVHITGVRLLPSKVTHLIISKPPPFKYRPGDYIFINIPEIASYEWHPFTISSAPELQGEIWLHVRSCGHWTNRCYEFFDNYAKNDEVLVNVGIISSDGKKKSVCMETIENGLTNRTNRKNSNMEPSVKRRRSSVKPKKTFVKAFIDGPYGTSTREIFETEHVVLIASGIGVTPYASILQSIVHRYKNSCSKCPNCEYEWHDPDKGSQMMKIRKVDFIWINRDQKCFEWFISLLTKLELEQQERGSFEDFLDMQMFMTSALDKNDMKGIGLQMALEILHRKEQRDIITGLKTRTQAGRPNFDEIFSKIASERKGKVKIFFCGSPQLAKSIKMTSELYGLDFAKENF